MIITGVKAGDHVHDATEDETKIYKIKSIANVIVVGRLEVRLCLENEDEELKETKTITSDEFLVMRIIGVKACKVMTIVSRGNANIAIDHHRTVTFIANRRDQVGEGEVNTISLPAFDKRYPWQAPYKPKEEEQTNDANEN